VISTRVSLDMIRKVLNLVFSIKLFFVECLVFGRALWGFALVDLVGFGWVSAPAAAPPG